MDEDGRKVVLAEDVRNSNGRALLNLNSGQITA